MIISKRNQRTDKRTTINTSVHMIKTSNSSQTLSNIGNDTHKTKACMEISTEIIKS